MQEDDLNQRLKASSHYCDRQKQALFTTHYSYSASQKFKKSAKDYLMSVLPVSALRQGKILACKLVNFLVPFLGAIHKKYYSNNSLCIDITTVCNLRCFNCQSSVRQAPANDNMSVEQIERFVQEAIDLKYYWDRISLFGGEPTLHPQFFEILGALKRYKDFNPDCIIDVITNGAGERVNSVLSKLPGWLAVENTGKVEGQNSHPFGSYNIAPIDCLPYRFFTDFAKGCSRVSFCYGLELSMYGYYPCSPCMGVDRVFGFDIGIKKLSLVSEKALREQMKILCQYCGWFREPTEIIWKEKISHAWKRAYAEYKKQRPKLSLY